MWGWNKGKPAYSAYERDMLKAIDKHGWYGTAVYDPDGGDPTFAYSTGFSKTLDAPEFIMFGQPMELMNHVLWTLFDKIKEGKQPADGQRWPDFVEGFECEIRRVHPDNLVIDYLNSALWYWGAVLGRTDGLPVFQVVWPSAKTGLFPWEKGCAEEVRLAQPPLYLPRTPLN